MLLLSDSLRGVDIILAQATVHAIATANRHSLLIRWGLLRRLLTRFLVVLDWYSSGIYLCLFLGGHGVEIVENLWRLLVLHGE